MRNWIGATMVAVMLVPGSGCSALAVRLGLRVRLDTVPVTSLSASMVNRHDSSGVSALAPGQSARLVVVATTDAGKHYATVGAGNGKVAFDNYTIEATTVQVSKRGTVSLPADPRVSEGKLGHLRISPTGHPEVVTEIDVPVRYDMPFVADFSGARGSDGFDGTDGSDGSSGQDGTPATIDPTTGVPGNPGPGGNGGAGGNGGNGQDGSDGSPGESVHVWIRLEPGAKPLLQIEAKGARRELFYIVDPSGGSLKILSNGGSGGRGGHGGRAGHGGSGGSGFPSGFSGVDGLAGSDGQPGRDGAGGAITVSVDPAAQPFLGCITWSNRGTGGSAKATTTIEPVAALW
jgi:hypothetical protein